jgi:hypothetical protein
LPVSLPASPVPLPISLPGSLPASPVPSPVSLPASPVSPLSGFRSGPTGGPRAGGAPGGPRAPSSPAR